MMKYSVERKEKREEAGWNVVVFETEKERTDWLVRNCDEVEGEWFTNEHNDEVRLHDFETHNADEVLHAVCNCLDILEERPWQKNFPIVDVCSDLSIFDWWRDTLSKSQLKKMRSFLDEAIKLGYTGYVCFKVGASGCANGMWAHKEETTTGYSPDGEFLYRSFTPDYTCWEVRAADGKTYPTGDQWDSIKTKKQLEELVNQINSNTVPKRPALKITFLRDGEEFTDTTEGEITFNEEGRVCFKTLYFSYALETKNVVKIESIQL